MRKLIATLCPLVVLLGAILVPRAARAQDSANAEVLFQKARQLLEEKRYAEACPKFADSYQLEKVSGALLALAACHELEGKLASAWAELVEVATLARREGKNDRAQIATERAAFLEPRLAKLTIALAQGAETVPGLVVKRDGVVVAAGAFGTAVPVDRGPHVVEASAPGRAPFSKRVTMPDGATELVPIPVLSDAGGAEPVPVAPPAPPEAPAQPAPKAEAASAFPLRTVGLVTGALGVVVAGVGGYFGFEAISKNSDSNKTGCTGDVCVGAGKLARLDAVSAGKTATVLVVVGGALAAGGLVMFLVGGPSSGGDNKPAVAAAPAVDAHSAGFALTGRF